MEKIKTIDDMVKEDISLLSRYDESSAKEIDELKAQSEALENKKAQLLEEIERAKKQLALADRKSRLNEIYKEQERLEAIISDIKNALPKLQAKVESYKFDFDISSLQEQYQKTISEINDAIARRESFNSQLIMLKDEIKSLNNSVKEASSSLNSINKDISDLKQKADTLRSRVEGLQRLKTSLSQKTDALHNPYKEAIETLQTDIKGLSELCIRLANDYGNLIGATQGLLNSIKDKSQFAHEIGLQVEEINKLKSQTQRLQDEINQKTTLIDEIIKQTTADKEKALLIQNELDNILNELSNYLEEIAKIKELTKAKDEAEERFRRLLLENVLYSEGIKTASRGHRKIKDIVRKLL